MVEQEACSAALEFTKLYYDCLDKKRTVSLFFNIVPTSSAHFNNTFAIFYSFSPNSTWILLQWFGMGTQSLVVRKSKNF